VTQFTETRADLKHEAKVQSMQISPAARKMVSQYLQNTGADKERADRAAYVAQANTMHDERKEVRVCVCVCVCEHVCYM
jgi:hypothetical protein